MKFKGLPLKEISIKELYNGEKVTYEVPIYQRNYAWEKDEISALVQDVYDAFISNKECYYIGTLVSYNKGEHVFEIIDGQQRLTTINLILHALGVEPSNKLTYRARVKSTKTLKSIPLFDVDEKDLGIFNGYRYADSSIKEIVPISKKENFINYFQNKVHIIHYQVPKDVDLNHYFEVMNSRGEQLEKHEIVKAKLLAKLGSKSDRNKFNKIWENCCDMSVYIQDKYYNKDEKEPIFGNKNDWLWKSNFEELPSINDKEESISISIKDILDSKGNNLLNKGFERNKKDSFQPIIDFPNFLLIVLKITRITTENDFDYTSFNLDDKELLNEFNSKKFLIDETWVKNFGFNLLKAKYFLDNYIIHHSNEEDIIDNNPWKLQYWQKTKDDKTGYVKNLCEDDIIQDTLVQLLSMFEVSFTARQRKNYLFYCLLYLFKEANPTRTFIRKYSKFVSNLANKYYKDVYLNKELLNEINVPIPEAFDKTILTNGEINLEIYNDNLDFNSIYGDGTLGSRGIPLFIFNFLDYKLWESYLPLKGQKTKEESSDRQKLFARYGCSDFGLKIFEQFYFSRTRRSLEHYFPQANVDLDSRYPNESQINCLGNYAMIGNEINSSGSNWSPKVKLDHYLDTMSGKIKMVSVASIKFMIMMQICKDNVEKRDNGLEWLYEDIKKHQSKMLSFLK